MRWVSLDGTDDRAKIAHWVGCTGLIRLPEQFAPSHFVQEHDELRARDERDDGRPAASSTELDHLPSNPGLRLAKGPLEPIDQSQPRDVVGVGLDLDQQFGEPETGRYRAGVPVSRVARCGLVTGSIVTPEYETGIAAQLRATNVTHDAGANRRARGRRRNRCSTGHYRRSLGGADRDAEREVCRRTRRADPCVGALGDAARCPSVGGSPAGSVRDSVHVLALAAR